MKEVTGFRVLNSEPASGWLTTCGCVAGPRSYSSSVLPFFLFLLVWTCLSVPCLCPCSHPHVVVIYGLLEISSATSLFHSKTTSHSLDISLLAAANDTTTTLLSQPPTYERMCAWPLPIFLFSQDDKITVISMLGTLILSTSLFCI